MYLYFPSKYGNLFQTVYVIIGMFVFATVIATYACFEPLVMGSYSVFPRPILQLPRINLGCAVIHMELRFYKEIYHWNLPAVKSTTS